MLEKSSKIIKSNLYVQIASFRRIILQDFYKRVTAWFSFHPGLLISTPCDNNPKANEIFRWSESYKTKGARGKKWRVRKLNSWFAGTSYGVCEFNVWLITNWKDKKSHCCITKQSKPFTPSSNCLHCRGKRMKREAMWRAFQVKESSWMKMAESCWASPRSKGQNSEGLNPSSLFKHKNKQTSHM